MNGLAVLLAALAAAVALAALYRRQRQLERQLREQSDRLSTAQRDNAALLRMLREHAIVSVADRAGRIIGVNDGFCSISGFSRDELMGRNHRIVNSGTHGPEFWAGMWRTIAAGRSWRGEVCNRAKDGSLYWVDNVIAPLFGADGQIDKYISIRTDITERKRVGDSLRMTNERFEIATAAAGIGVWEYDVAAGALVWDARMFELYGHAASAGEVPYSLWSRSLHPEDRARCEEALVQALDGAQEFDAEFRIVRPDGELRHLKAAARVVRDAHGRALRMSGVNIDVTVLKTAELQRQQRERLMRLVIDSFPGPLAHWDAEMRCTFANRAYEDWMGLDPAQMVGRSQRELFGDELHRLNEPHMLAALRGEQQQAERSQVIADGSLRHYLLRYVPDQEGDQVRGFISVAMDVSEMKHAENQLRGAVHKARLANLAKSQFLANMSHEIRTPMNAVIGLSYLMERTPLNTEQAGFLGKIKLASKSLLAIINNVLDLSKIEASELRIERAPFRLQTTLHELAELARTQADAKGIGFATELPEGLPATLEGDATRLHQILTNLTANAIKFTERGTVALGVQVVSASADAVRLRFVVKDSGIGIAPEALARLFNPFAQADDSTTRRFGGTGLGLSIVKQLAALMGGEVGVISTLGSGSEFWVELPFAVSAAALTPPALYNDSGEPGLRGVRVLVADDSAVNLEVAKRILELEGASVQLAGNGQEAVDHLLADPKGFDVVLMDVQMPVLDGYDATRRIRSGLGLTRLPIIALTAGALTTEQQRAEAAGMSDFLSKPFEPWMLVQRIRRHLPVGGAQPPSRLPSAVGPVPEWPQIDGIDSRDVCARLGGDVDLLGALLRRLLDDFADLGREVAEAAADPAADLAADRATLDGLAARMHNLKGSSATLGAKTIAHHAGQAEAACNQGQRDQALHLGRVLVEQLDQLRRSAAPTLAAVDDSAGESTEETEAPAAAMDAAELAALLHLLRQFNLGALDRFAALSAPLRRHLGRDSYSLVREQIGNLQFGDAAKVLEELHR